MRERNGMGRIAVTGGGGLLGANLVYDWATAGHHVVSLDRNSGAAAPGAGLIYADISDPAIAGPVLEQLQPRWIVHCAALTAVDWCESHAKETLRVNAEAPRHLAATARKMGAGFLYISTDSVFDGATGGYREVDTPCPLNVYARAKLAGERAVLEEHPGALVVRTNIYGWNLRPKLSLAEWVLQRLESAQEVPGFSDVSFCPILVNDLGNVLRSMMKLGLSGVYHVSGGEAIDKYEFAVAVAQTFGHDPARVLRSRLSDSALTAARPLNTSLNVDKAAEALGAPLPGVREGLQRFRALRDQGQVAELKSLRRGGADA
jgi:dTDP-4-dehydrorhamnose reductase